MAAPLKLRANTPEVQQYLDLSLQLIAAAAGVAGEGAPSEEEMAMLRQIQIVNAALSQALTTLSQRPPQVMMPPAPLASRAPPPRLAPGTSP